MAQYIQLNDPGVLPNAKGQVLLNGILQLRAGFATLQAEGARMAAMQGSSIAEVVSVYGVKQGDFGSVNAAAQHLYDELNSALGNSAALLQLLSELG